VPTADNSGVCRIPEREQKDQISRVGEVKAYRDSAGICAAIEEVIRRQARKLATVVAGQRPVDLTKQEAAAYDFASALVSGGVLPELTYKAALEQFGPHGAAELS
jgi:hypothetical protein